MGISWVFHWPRVHSSVMHVRTWIKKTENVNENMKR